MFVASGGAASGGGGVVVGGGGAVGSEKRTVGSFAVRGVLQCMYRPPPPYCRVSGRKWV